MIAQIRPYVRYFHSSQWVDDLANGEICLALGWSGSAALARHNNSAAQLRYIVPKEGALLWLDVLAIPADATHVDNAHRLIDYLLRPTVAAAFTNSRFYPNPIRTAKAKKFPSGPYSSATPT